MILTLITLDSPKHVSSFDEFLGLTEQRYSSYLSQPLTPFKSGTWYTAVKPYHSGIFPFLAFDMMVMFRALPCQFFFGHDLLTFGSAEAGEIQVDDGLLAQFEEVLRQHPSGSSHMHFQGFGSRIDIGLNALSRLYVDNLTSLTRVESEVLTHLRTLQFDKYGDPMNLRTFGLQKQVAERLDKSPVAIHKSLRSAKFALLAETATAMKEMMV